MKDGSAAKSALLLVGKRLGWRPIDVAQTVTQPRKVARMDAMLQDMELGKLKVQESATLMIVVNDMLSLEIHCQPSFDGSDFNPRSACVPWRWKSHWQN